jgi:beta-lactamase regulating signal transducer with metallopeptidase domain
MTSIHIPAVELLGSAVIRILAGYLLFYALTRLASRAAVRHILWLLFLAASSCYWLTAVKGMMKVQPVTSLASSRAVLASSPAIRPKTVTTLTIPHTWNWGIAPALAFLFWIYAAGAAAMFVRIARRRVRLREAMSQARLAAPELEAIFVEQCRRLEISRCRILLELPGLSSPGTAYVWNPVVIMPEGLDAYLDYEQMVDVLYHELMHVKRLDFLWSTFAEFAACLLFFHPAVWLALRNLGRDRELACDMAVMELRHGRRQDYALCLTRMARRQVLGFEVEPPNDLALLNSFLTFRVKMLLAERRRRGPMIRAMATLTGIGAVLFFAAGWSSLRVAVELADAAPRVMATARSVVRPVARRIGVPRQRAPQQPEANLPPASGLASEMDEAAAQPVMLRYSPIDPSLDGGTSGEAESGAMGKMSRTPGNDPSVPSPGQSGPSWKKTASAAAIGALGRVAAGRRDGDGGGDADDRTSKP